MIENTKCECGHQNPLGTVLCESCGKPMQEVENTATLEMRYDGVARRSQRVNPTWIDQIWRFFSSVKIAVYLIIITLILATLGTIYPQENTFINIDPSVYYKETYGWTGHIYYLLGLSHTYDTWWFRALLFMIGTSLVICSLDRVLPLYRALSKQQIRKHLQFITRQKIVYQGDLPSTSQQPTEQDKEAQAWVEQTAKLLRKKNYRVHTDGTALMAEKYRFSRWGPYINHIGLIIFLLAVLARALPGMYMDQYMGFLEGSVEKIDNTSYYLKNEKFSIDFYTEEEMAQKFRDQEGLFTKTYQTTAVLYECVSNCDVPGQEPELKEVKRHDIIVNKPLSYKGLLLYQFDYRITPQLISVRPQLVDKRTGESYGSFLLPMKHPEQQYEVGPYKLALKSYFPEFTISESGTPSTVSNEPKMPAFIFSITGPGMDASGEPFIYFPRQIDQVNFRQDELNGSLSERFELAVAGMEDVEIAEFTSFLNVRVDRAIPYIWVGAAISMLGLIMGFYWQHRRIWLRIDGSQLSLGAHTNKNWIGLRRETGWVLHRAGITVDDKILERGKSS